MGATCEQCGEDMLEVKSCRCNDVVTIDRTEWQTIPYINTLVFTTRTGDIVGELSQTCHDCGVQIGAKHHPSCDMERCPKCGGQLISCGCLDEEDEEDE